MSDQIIIFFDGRCNLCDRFVHFVLKRDAHRRFLYSPLQGQTASQKLQKKDVHNLKSIVVLKKGMVLKEAQALKAIMKEIYPRGSILFSFLPLSFFNIFYRLIAKRRYAFFGKKETLYQALEHEKEFFLP